MSGEEDYTQRVKAYQQIATDIRSLIHGQDTAVIISDEGTESSAGDYSTPGGFGGTVADDAVTKQVGVNSLKLTAAAGATTPTAKIRALGTTFLWGDYVTGEVQIYRNDAGSTQIHLKLLSSNSIYAGGQLWTFDLSMQTVGTWKTYTLAKGDSTPNYGGAGSGTTLTHMAWYWHHNDNDPSDIVYLDGLNFQSGSGSVIAFEIDSSGRGYMHIYGYDGATARRITTDAAGHLQIDALTMPAITVSGSVDVDDVNTVALHHDQVVTAINTTDLITPGGSEKIQVKSIDIASATDDVFVKIWEEDNNGHICWHGNMLDGNIVCKNLIGANYLTSTNGKKLQCDLSKGASVAISIGYVLV